MRKRQLHYAWIVAAVTFLVLLVTAGVRATPGFFIEGKRQDVSFGLRLLFDATEKALQRG